MFSRLAEKELSNPFGYEIIKTAPIIITALEAVGISKKLIVLILMFI